MIADYQMDVHWEQIQHILQAELKRDLAFTLNDIEKVEKTGKGFVYSLDAEEDLIELNIRAMALAVVVHYYGGFEE